MRSCNTTLPRPKRRSAGPSPAICAGARGMSTLSKRYSMRRRRYDREMVLPVEKVMYQAQEVAAVLATDRYTAADGVTAVEVAYEPLPVVVDPFKALEPGAPVLRTDKPGKTDNRIFHWEVGDKAATDRAFRDAAVTVKEDIYIPRIHVCSIETCGCVAQFDRVSGQLTVWMTTQAPHAIRTIFALVAGHVGLAE